MSEDINRLTDKERECLLKLVEAHELYLELPVQHPMHIHEWIRDLHYLQRLLMSRPTARVEDLTAIRGMDKVPYQKGELNE